MSIISSDRGTRRKPHDVRREALAIGRRLLLDGGPRALTLKAVAGAMNMSHANLIHHFGSAEAFQQDLKAEMISELTRAATAMVERSDEAEAGTVIDMVFDAYGSGGIGTLLAWSALFQPDQPVEGPLRAVQDLVAVLAQQMEGDGKAERARAMVCLVTSLALADSLIGRDLAQILGGGDRPVMRDLAALLLQRLAEPRRS